MLIPAATPPPASPAPTDVDTDVVVAGSGAAGLVAALAAAQAGARVVILEKAAVVGGTTAISGGAVWVPGNHHMAALGVADARDAALTYLTRLADGRGDEQLLTAFLDAAPAAVRFMEDASPVRFRAVAGYPDYHPEFAGACAQGRTLDPQLYDLNQLGPWRDRIRQSPVFGRGPMTVAESVAWHVFAQPAALPFAQIRARAEQGLVGRGAALAGGLLEAVLGHGIVPHVATTAQRLLVDGGRVVGLEATQAGASIVFRAQRGVVLASGGFEWDSDSTARFLGGPLARPLSPPTQRGDALRLAMSVGADLANMTEAWWCPAFAVPGERYEGQPLYRPDFGMRALPHAILVNRAGQRFVNEATNYNDLCKAFFHFDPGSYERPNLPCWLIIDQAFVDRYLLIDHIPGTPLPEWMPRAERLETLAEAVGIQAAGLRESVQRFNAGAAAGHDADFGRGVSAFDRFHGDPAHTPHPSLGTIAQAPFYALNVNVGALGTKGGPRVDAGARVQHVDGGSIAGLYAAGNAMATPFGAGYPGAGSTLANAITFGYLAGRAAAGQPLSPSSGVWG